MKSKRTLKLLRREREINSELHRKRVCKLNDNCEARESGIHNFGVFATKDIGKGEKVIEYVGEKVSKRESDRRADLKNGAGDVYLFTLNSKYDIDGARGGNGAQYINHSCDPNCEAVNEENSIWIFSTRKIKKGEELTYNYGFDIEDYKDHVCKCGSKKCVGYIIDEKHWKKLK